MQTYNELFPIPNKDSLDNYYGVCHTENYYKGKSFNFKGDWSSGVHYFNDDYTTDFVAYKGALLACIAGHLSSTSNQPELLYEDSEDSTRPTGVNSTLWSFVFSGTPGAKGDNGKVYIPNYDPVTGIVKWNLSSESPEIEDIYIKGDKGDKGNGIVSIKKTNSNNLIDTYTITYDSGSTDTFEIINGKAGEPGIQGAPGRGIKSITGPVISGLYNTYTIILTDGSEFSFTIKNGSQGTPGKDGIDGQDGKDGKQIKLYRDFSDDSIKWGYDGDKVSEWTVLCYMDDLKGDENIWLSCEAPEDTSKIWYDPCDEAVDSFSSSDFLYQSYLDSGGTLSKSDFIKAFSSLNKTTGFEIKFALSFEDLGEPNDEKSNILWLVPNTQLEQYNSYDEYIAIYNQTTQEYSWELWGSQNISVNLENYYTKDEVDSLLQEVTSTIWIPL